MHISELVFLMESGFGYSVFQRQQLPFCAYFTATQILAIMRMKRNDSIMDYMDKYCDMLRAFDACWALDAGND